jgi:hypothetical protein
MLNITPYHLTDAVPTALFGIFALWAASSKRHWFVRTAAVGGALLVLLLVPAYEVVIQFGGIVLFMVIVLAVWRQRRKRTVQNGTLIDPLPKRLPSVSLATVMLLIVVVAVVTSVAARVPQWSLSRWIGLIGTSLVGGAIGIGCVWIVCGRAAWWVRLLASPLLLAGFTVTIYVLGYVPSVVADWAQGNYRPLDYYWKALTQSAWWGIAYGARTIGIGMAIMVARMLSFAARVGSIRSARRGMLATRRVWSIAGRLSRALPRFRCSCWWRCFHWRFFTGWCSRRRSQSCSCLNQTVGMISWRRAR